MFHFLWRGGGRPAWPSCSSQWASSWAGPSVLAGSRLETRLLTLPILPGKIRVSYFYSAGLEGLEGTLALEVTMETKHLQYTVHPTVKISLISHWFSCFLLHIIFTVQLRRYCD